MTALSPLRVGRITGSRIAAVLGMSPYATPDDVLREMVRQAHGAAPEFEGNRATEWGNDHELDGIGEWEFRTGEALYATGDQQVFIPHPHVDWLGVTPDGVTGDGNAVEVKCPLWGAYTHWQDVPWYEQQLRLVADCLAADWVDLTVWRPSGTTVSRVERDPWWLEQNMPALEAFMQRYEQTVADEALYGPLLAPLADVRADPEWSEAAARYRETMALSKVAEREAAEAREALLALTDRPAKGCGVTVSLSQRKGTVDYKAAVAELVPDVDLDGWRKPGSEVWTVRVAS